MAWPTPWPQGMVKGIAGLETKVAIGLVHKPGPRLSVIAPTRTQKAMTTHCPLLARAAGEPREPGGSSSGAPSHPSGHGTPCPRSDPTQETNTTGRGGQHSAWGACRSSRWDTWRQSQPDPSRAPGRRGSGSVFARRWRGAHRALPKSSPFTALRSVDVEIHCTTSTE